MIVFFYILTQKRKNVKEFEFFLKKSKKFVVFLTISPKKETKNRTRVTKIQKMQEIFAKTLVYFAKMS